MFRHLLKLAFRNLKKKASFSILNIAGFSLGLTAFFVIGLYVFQEVSYDKGFDRHESTYRLYTKFLNASLLATSSPGLYNALMEQPEVEIATQVRRIPSSSDVKVGITTFKTIDYLQVDSSFLAVFDFESLYGNVKTALSSPDVLVLTDKEALRLFGRKDVVGEFVKLKDRELQVRAVLKSSLFKTHLKFNALVTNSANQKKQDTWMSLSVYTYAVLRPNVSTDQLNTRLKLMMKDYIFPAFLKELPIVDGYTFEQWEKSESVVRNYAQPITDIHLSSDLTGEWYEGGDKSTVTAFAIIAIFILIISCANFINLSTAQASDRAKEIGIKKVLGTSRSMIRKQLIAESILIIFLAGILSLGMTELAIKGVNTLFEGFISTSLIDSPEVIIFLLAFLIVIGGLSAFYPAMYLSSFQPISLLKGQKVKGFNGAGAANRFRSILVTIQFTLSTVLMIGAISMSSQLRYMTAIDLGFNQKGILVIPDAYRLGSEFSAFRTEVSRLSFVKASSGIRNLPGDGRRYVQQEIETKGDDQEFFTEFVGDSNMPELLELEVVNGTSFSNSSTLFEQAIIINETAASLIGDIDIIGSTLNNKTVIGVIKDFHYESLRERIEPLMITADNRPRALAIKMELTSANIAQVDELWQQFTSISSNRYFLEDNYKALINREYNLGNAFAFFTVLAVIISCLGMYGLTLFAADQRAKEFGIRKVLGARAIDLIQTLMSSFIKLVFISMLLSIPLAYYGLNKWLADFAYRIDISSIYFLMGAVLVLLLVLLTVFRQSYKVSVRNPVNVLKNH